jgi:hypothetical protein
MCPEICPGLLSVVGSAVHERLATVSLVHRKVVADLSLCAGGVRGGGGPPRVVMERAVVLRGRREGGRAVKEVVGGGGMRVPV